MPNLELLSKNQRFPFRPRIYFFLLVVDFLHHKLLKYTLKVCKRLVLGFKCFHIIFSLMPLVMSTV